MTGGAVLIDELLQRLDRDPPEEADADGADLPGFTEALLVDFRAHAPHLSAVLVMPGHVRSGMPAPPRSWRRALDSLFADYQPVPSTTAAAAIIDAVREGRWRVVIGDDAEAVDQRVRADPWTAYD